MRPQQVCPFSVLKEAPFVWTAKNIRFLVGCAHNVGALKTKPLVIYKKFIKEEVTLKMII